MAPQEIANPNTSQRGMSDADIGLTLSGGGFRATLFHLGALWRLNELGFLKKISRVSSVSGGSITAAYLGMQWKTLSFENGIATNFEQKVVEGVRDFCSRNIDIWSILRILPRPWAWRHSGNSLAASYRRYLFRSAELQDLPEEPRFIILATNLLTGAAFRFTKHAAGDYRYGRITNPRISLADAVAASSAFPPVLSPFRLRVKPSLFENQPGADMHGQVTNYVYLSDAGIYDNLGLEPIWDRCETVLISDASAPPQFENPVLPLWITLTKRSVDIATYQSLPARRRIIIDEFTKGTKKGTYWSINAFSNTYNVKTQLGWNDTLTKLLARTRTRLNHFTEREQCLLINWGYAVSDAAIRMHVVKENCVKQPRWPYPDFQLSDYSLSEHAQAPAATL